MTLRRPRYIGATDVFMAQLLQATTNPHQAKPLAEVERDQWRERARQLQEMVDRVQKATLGHASVLHVDQRRATVRLGNNIAIADLPSDLEVREGDVILVTAEGNICGIAGEMPRTGNVFTVKRILPGPAVEVSAPGMPGKSVIVCREDLKATLQVGDPRAHHARRDVHDPPAPARALQDGVGRADGRALGGRGRLQGGEARPPRGDRLPVPARRRVRAPRPQAGQGGSTLRGPGQWQDPRPPPPRSPRSTAWTRAGSST